MEQSDYDYCEQYGRDLFLKWAKQSDFTATECRKKVAAGMNSRGRVLQKAVKNEERASILRLRANDATRYLWRISVGGYGDFFWVGTDASAKGRCALKATWEGAPGSHEAIRPARDSEANGPMESNEIEAVASY